jgi:hypothetical protein
MINNNIIIILIIITISIILYNYSHDKECFSNCNATQFPECPQKNDLNFNFNYYNPTLNIEPKLLDYPTDYKYINIGCYNDSSEYLIPFKIATVSSLCEAFKIANLYGAPLFGLQNNGELFIGYDIKRAISHGLSSGVCDLLGSPKQNQIYVTPLILSTPENNTYNYAGCFLDSPEHLIPIFIGRINNLEQAFIIANLFGAPVFGIQNGGDLYIGYDIIKAKLLGPSKNICCPLGGILTNQVYYIF